MDGWRWTDAKDRTDVFLFQKIFEIGKHQWAVLEHHLLALVLVIVEGLAFLEKQANYLELSLRILEFGDKLGDSIVASLTVSLGSKEWLTEVKGFADAVGVEKRDSSEEKLGIMIYHGKTLFLQRRNLGAGHVEGLNECILVVVILEVINGEGEILITQLTNLVIISRWLGKRSITGGQPQEEEEEEDSKFNNAHNYCTADGHRSAAPPPPLLIDRSTFDSTPPYSLSSLFFLLFIYVHYYAFLPLKKKVSDSLGLFLRLPQLLLFVFKFYFS